MGKLLSLGIGGVVGYFIGKSGQKTVPCPPCTACPSVVGQVNIVVNGINNPQTVRFGDLTSVNWDFTGAVSPDRLSIQTYVFHTRLAGLGPNVPYVDTTTTNTLDRGAFPGTLTPPFILSYIGLLTDTDGRVKGFGFRSIQVIA